MESVREALFVINQDASLENIKLVCRSQNIRTALVLTSHCLYAPEQEIVRQVASNVEFKSFADFLSEKDMCQCDETVEQLLRGEKSHGEKYDNSKFTALSLHEKNRIVHKRLADLYHFQNVYYTPGLGVAESYWQNIGKPLVQKQIVSEQRGEHKAASKYSKLMHYAVRIKEGLFKPEEREVFLIREGGSTYVFFSPLKRLRIVPKTQVETVKISSFSINILRYSVMAKAILKLNFVSYAMAYSWFRHLFGNDAIFCITLHGYERIIAEPLVNVLVFVDGYLPSNYPHSYTNYYEDNVFVVHTMFDERWFKAIGKRTQKPPAFVQREYFAPCVANTDKHVLVALGHAGDWTALINRSDTDLLVASTVNMAQKLPQVAFRIRIHPTMNHPAHEGVNSSERIKRFIYSANLPNLHFSTQNLEEDISWSNICLSEYSQVLLDVMRSGKIGVSVNLTARRSFMQDYADSGFFHASSQEEAIVLLKRISEDPILASKKQNEAVCQYNALLSDWLGENL